MRFELREINKAYSEFIVHVNSLAVDDGTLDYRELVMLQEEFDCMAHELEERLEDMRLYGVDK